jgi:hypothetical protein
MTLRGAIMIGVALSGACTTQAQDLLPRRDVFVDPDAPEGGDGTREHPYRTLQQTVDQHDAEWGQVFIRAGVYEEDVVIDRGRFWFMPAEQYDVVLRGSITIKRPGTIIRGMNIHSEGSGIVLAEGADGCRIQQNRIHAIGEGHAGIEITGSDCSDCLISDNIVDLRDGEGGGRTGIRVQVAERVARNRLSYNQIAGCETGIAFSGSPTRTDLASVASANRLLANTTGLIIAAPGVSARYNEFRGQTSVGARVDGTAALLEANRFLDGARGIVTAGAGVAVQSNVVARAAEAAVTVAAGDATVLHNTLHGAPDGGPLLTVSADATCEATGNIFSAAGEVLNSEGDLTLSGNLFSAEGDAAEADPDSIVGDPGFVDPDHDDFHLRADSPAAHAAEASQVRLDADGIGRPWGPAASMGAYEAAGTREARIIHVAPGAENGDGSAEAPLASIATACARARPGDEVVLADGEYTLEEEIVGCAGAPDAPVTIRPANPDGAILVDSRLYFVRCSYMRVDGLHFREPQAGYIGLGPHSRHNAVVNTVAVREAEGGGSGIGISGPGAERNLFENNVIALNRGGVGISLRCQQYNWHQTIRGNDISGCYYGIQTGGGSYPTAPPGYHVIEGNALHHNWKDGLHTKGTDQIICGNHFYDNTGHAITTRYGARNVIVGNWIHDNGNGMRLHSPSHFVVNNVIYNNRGWGIHASSWPGGKDAPFPYNFEPSYEPPHEIWIAHNTIVGNGRVPIDANVGSRLMVLRNILVGDDPSAPAIDFAHEAAARQVEGNLYWNGRPPLLREYEGGRYSVVADPMFTAPDSGDFRLLEDSPAWQMPHFRDALSSVLSDAPCGIDLPEHIGASLPPVSEAPQGRPAGE